MTESRLPQMTDGFGANAAFKSPVGVGQLLQGQMERISTMEKVDLIIGRAHVEGDKLNRWWRRR